MCMSRGWVHWGGACLGGRHRGEERRQAGDIWLDSVTERIYRRAVWPTQETDWPLDVCPCVH